MGKKRLLNNLKEVFSVIRNKHLLLLAVIGIDLLFFLSFTAFNLIWAAVFPASDIFNELLQIKLILVFSTLLLIGYFGLTIALYSVFKYIALSFIVKAHKKERLDFSGFRQFFIFNILALIILFGTYMLVSFFAFTYVAADLIGWFGILTLLPLTYFAYPYVNAVQLIIVKDKMKLFKGIKKGFTFLKKRFLGYSAIYLYNIIFIAVYSLIFFLLTALLNILFFKNNQFSTAFNLYQWTFTYLNFVLMLAMINFNRLYFYRLLEE